MPRHGADHSEHTAEAIRRRLEQCREADIGSAVMDSAVGFGDHDDGNARPAILQPSEELLSIQPRQRQGCNHKISRPAAQGPGPHVPEVHVRLLHRAERVPDRASDRGRVRRITRRDHDSKRHGAPFRDGRNTRRASATPRAGRHDPNRCPAPRDAVPAIVSRVGVSAVRLWPTARRPVREY